MFLNRLSASGKRESLAAGGTAESLSAGGTAVSGSAETGSGTTQAEGSPVTRLLARKGATAFLLNASGMGLAFLLQVVLARLLGAAEYGHYAFVMTVATFLVFPAKLGFDTTIVRYAAAYREEKRWAEVKGLLRYANRWTVSLSAIVALVGLAAVVVWNGFLATKADGDLVATFAIGLPLVPILALATLRQSALQSLGEVLYAQMPEKIWRPVLLIGFLFAVAPLAGHAANAPLAMALFGLSLLATYVFGAWVLRRKLGPHVRTVEPAYERKRWMRTSLSLMVNAGIYLILGQLGVLMTGIIHGTYESGILSASVRIAALVTFAMTAINMTAAPLMSAAYAKGDKRRLQSVVTASGVAALAFAAAVFAVLAGFGGEVLKVFGPEFEAGTPALLLMSGGQLVNALCGQTGMVMTMTGHEGVLTKALLVSAALNIGLNGLLIPVWGMTGAGMAMLVAGSFWPVAMVFVVQRKLGIRTSLPQLVYQRLWRERS